MNKTHLKIFGFALVLLAIAIMVEQYYTWGVAFEPSDIHHELFITTFFCTGITVLFIGFSMKKGGKRR